MTELATNPDTEMRLGVAAVARLLDCCERTARNLFTKGPESERLPGCMIFNRWRTSPKLLREWRQRQMERNMNVAIKVEAESALLVEAA